MFQLLEPVKCNFSGKFCTVVYSFSGIRCQLFESELAWKLKVFSQRSSYILNTTSFFTIFVRGISYSSYNMQHKYHSFVFQYRYLFQIICQNYIFNIHLLQLNSSLSVNELAVSIWTKGYLGVF